MVKKNLIFILLVFLVLPMISAYDSETIGICGGDEETLILCVGDLENSPIGRNVYTSPEVTGRTGGSGGISTFNVEEVCLEVSDFLNSGNITNESRKLLSLAIKNDTGILVSKSVLNHYIDNFEYVCNMTINEPTKEVEQKVKQSFLLFFIIALAIVITYYRKKIKKVIIAFFDNEDEDLIEYVKRD